jgi:hypothetical protein
MIYKNTPHLGAKTTDYRVYYTRNNLCVYRSASLSDAKRMAEFWHQYEVEHGTQQHIIVRKYVIRDAHVAGQSLD